MTGGEGDCKIGVDGRVAERLHHHLQYAVMLHLSERLGIGPK